MDATATRLGTTTTPRVNHASHADVATAWLDVDVTLQRSEHLLRLLGALRSALESGKSHIGTPTLLRAIDACCQRLGSGWALALPDVGRPMLAGVDAALQEVYAHRAALQLGQKHRRHMLCQPATSTEV